VFLQSRFKKDDLNGDGTITLEEMQAPLLDNRLLQDNSTKMALRKKLVQGRFEKLDRDNSGVLGEDEYTAIFDGGDQANELVHLADADGDGMISLAEFEDALQRAPPAASGAPRADRSPEEEGLRALRWLLDRVQVPPPPTRARLLLKFYSYLLLCLLFTYLLH
jgi:Ca2+-binding EF-hand superfamily protein